MSSAGSAGPTIPIVPLGLSVPPVEIPSVPSAPSVVSTPIDLGMERMPLTLSTAGTEQMTPSMEVSAIPIIIPTPIGEEVTPVTPELTPLTFEIEGKETPEEGIEHQLARLGYIVTAKILINGSDSGTDHRSERPVGTEARFLEAINPRGQKVFIELDTEGFVAISPSDLTLIEGKHATVIPYSVKVGALECAQMNICGVAFVCANGLCTLQREMAVGSGPNIYETNFIYTERVAIKDGTAKLGDRITPYPIVRLSEIVDSPEEMVRSVDTVTKRIRDTAYAGCKSDLMKTDDAITNLRKNFLAFKDAQEVASKRLTTSFEELEKVYKQYEAYPPKTDEDIQNYRLLISNMKKRHELAVDLQYMCQQVSRAYSEISRLSKHYEEALNTLKKEFAGVEYVIKE